MLYLREKFDKRYSKVQCWDSKSNALYVGLCGLDVERTPENVCRFYGNFKIIHLELEKQRYPC